MTIARELLDDVAKQQELKMNGSAYPKKVTLAVRAETRPGSSIRVTGSSAQFGAWDPNKSPELMTGPDTYPQWTVSLDTADWPIGGLEYKFVIREPEGKFIWEECPNRSICPKVAHTLSERAQGPWFGQADDPSSTVVDSTKASAKPSDVAPPAPKEAWAPTPAKMPEAPKLPEAKRDATPAIETNPQAKTLDAALMGKSAQAPQAVAAADALGAAKLLRHKRCASVPNMMCFAEDSKDFMPDCNDDFDGMDFGNDKWVPRAQSQPMEVGHPTKPCNPVDMGTIVWASEDPAAAVQASKVEVVFDADTSKPFALQRVGQGQRWSLDFASTGMAAGQQFFHFLIDGARSLSTAHFVFGGSNAMLFNGKVRRYIATYGNKEDAVGRGSAKFGRANSIGDPSPKSAAPMARPHSIANNLASLAECAEDSGDENEPAPQAGHTTAVSNRAGGDAFPQDVYEGLFDSSFCLRLHNLALPKAVAGASEAPSYRFHAAGWRLKKRSGSECEDAFFVMRNALGVADGVGSMVQFASYGVNSAAYAGDLMEKAKEYLEKNPSGPDGNATVDHWALGACKYAEEKTSEFGASTIAVVAMQKNTLGVANLGDSGYMLLRKGPEGMQIVHRSVEQQHGWNCPYQLMRIPPKLAARVPKYTQDHAHDCDLYTQEAQEGDLLLLFSDGVRDNLHDEEVLSIVDRALSPAFASFVGLPEKATNPSQIARALAKASEIRSLDPRARVPFTVYSLEHGYSCLGGKEDDITVIAAWVVPEHYVALHEEC